MVAIDYITVENYNNGKYKMLVQKILALNVYLLWQWAKCKITIIIKTF